MKDISLENNRLEESLKKKTEEVQNLRAEILKIQSEMSMNK